MNNEINVGVHQLPAPCYPPSESDDESFVVLESSFSLDVNLRDREDAREQFSSEVIEESLQVASDTLNTMTRSQLPVAPNILLESFESNGSVITQDEVHRQVELMIQENKKLKSTLEQNNIVMKTLKTWQEDVERVHNSHKKKFAETKIYIEELLNENRKLKSGQCIDPDVDLLKMEYSQNIVAQIEKNLQLENQLKQLEIDNDEMKKMISRREEDFDEKEQKYLQQITDLKAQTEQYVNRKKSQREAQAEQSDEIANLRKQLMEAQMYITDIKQSKKAIEVEAATNRRKIDELQKELSNVTRDSDRSMALEKQLEIYKNDFQAECESKKKVILEKNQMAEDMSNIQRRHDQLLLEIDALRSKCTFVEVTQAATASDDSSRAPPPSPPLTSYVCPLCMSKFRSIRILEDHVDLCINNNAV